MNTNLARLEILTDELEVHENDCVDYVCRAEYGIILVSPRGRIKWCNEFILNIINVEGVHAVVNKGLKRVIGVDLENTDTTKITIKNSIDPEQQFLVKQSELTRQDKLIHRKITLIPL